MFKLSLAGDGRGSPRLVNRVNNSFAFYDISVLLNFSYFNASFNKLVIKGERDFSGFNCLLERNSLSVLFTRTKKALSALVF